MKNIIGELFNFEIQSIKQIYSSDNEIYYQLLMYFFECSKKDIILVYKNINDATIAYNNLRNYNDNVFIFPEDDFLSYGADKTSPELLYLRLKLINNIKEKNKKIVILHYSSFVKKIFSYKEYKNKCLTISKNNEIDRVKLINNLNNIGYNRESLVTNVGEYAIRGYVIDIYPLNSENPIRIEFDDNNVEKIIEFNAYTQLSLKSKEYESIDINCITDNIDNKNSSIIELFDEPIVIYNNYEEILKNELLLSKHYENLNITNQIYKLIDLKTDKDVFINTIDNYGNYDIKIEANSLEYYDNKFEKFIEDIKKNDGTLYTIKNEIIEKCKDYNIKYINQYLNKGFEYKGKYYYSDNNLYYKKNHKSLINTFNYGTKIDNIDNIKIGDYVVHRKSGIGIYMGVQTITKNKMKKDYLLIQYKGNDKLYLPVEDIGKLYKYSSKEGTKPVIHKLNSLEWEKTKLKIKRRIKDITDNLIELYKERSKVKIEPYPSDDENQIIFENEFEYEETLDQIKAANEIKRDMQLNKPMERLLCGDVGYGKTEVIFRAVFKAILNGKQVAYLCPTTVLCMQQYESAIQRFKNHPINIDIINRNFTELEIKDKLEKLKSGKTDLIFGTHRLLSSDVSFNNLGFLVIDEEHRFGVEQKEKIKSISKKIHVLSVSATPIPRSLQMSLVGIRDMSMLETPPKNRYPVQTYVIEYSDILIRNAIIKEMTRNGQSFILFNNVKDMENAVNKYKKLIPEARICFAHGKMNKEEMSNIITSFKNYEYDVLISTTIIENGIDIPNANTIIVLDADKFGLSQLYQIRGRVGRSDKIAYAYLMYKKEKILSTTSTKRLDAIKEFTALGSGYKISMRDLAIRGAGDILGSEQAGFIDSVGVELYMDLIHEEVNKIDAEEEKKNVIPIDVETHIDEKYTNEDEIIIEIHKKINKISNKEEIDDLLAEIEDRFGTIEETTKIYVYEKYYEKLSQKVNIKIIQNDEIKIVLQIKKNLYQLINIEELFIQTIKISEKFNFNYKNQDIIITLTKTSLAKHYIYYIVELYELINKLINK